MARCGRQAEEIERLLQSPQPSVAGTHTVETHWRGTAMCCLGLMLDTDIVRPFISIKNILILEMLV